MLPKLQVCHLRSQVTYVDICILRVSLRAAQYVMLSISIMTCSDITCKQHLKGGHMWVKAHRH